jgi:surfeit locus 1 family protein
MFGPRSLGLMVVVGLALALLLTLAFWQLDRLQWKLELIATIEVRGNAAAVPLGDDPAEFTRAVVTGIYDHGRERHVLAQTHNGDVGVVVVAPLLMDDGRLLLVNRGWVPDAKRDAIGRGEGPVRLEGLVRMPPQPNAFTPENRPEEEQWYRIDPAAMAGDEALPFYLEATTVDPGVWPLPRQRALSLRNDHLQYALTWFALAAGLLVVYVVFRRQAGRAKP